MKKNYKDMKGQLEIMKTLGIKPNFSWMITFTTLN